MPVSDTVNADHRELLCAINQAALKARPKLATSMAFLIRDIGYVICCYVLSLLALRLGVPLVLVHVWHALTAGTVATGLWVLGHECGHGAFAQTRVVNDAVGFCLHSALLVPYFSWQFTHAKHHRHTNHAILGETHVPSTAQSVERRAHSLLGDDAFAALNICVHLLAGWPLYLFFNITGGRVGCDGTRMVRGAPKSHFNPRSRIFPPSMASRVAASTVGCIATLIVLSLTGWWEWYVGPYIVVNAWLVLYTWLQHTHPEIPHSDNYGFLEGALCTIDRDYGCLFDHLHHAIGSTHVLHHLRPGVPHYHAKAMTRVVKECLGEAYQHDATPIAIALWHTARTCHYVPSVHGVQKYRAYGRDAAKTS